MMFVLGIVVGLSVPHVGRWMRVLVSWSTRDRLPWETRERRQMMIAEDRRARYGR